MLEITAQRAREFNIAAQEAGESDDAFRHRVSGALRAQGHIIEAHEACQNALYDDPTANVMTGIFGAMAQMMQGREYRLSDGMRQVGDDIAAGVVAQTPQDDSAGMLAVLAVLMGA